MGKGHRKGWKKAELRDLRVRISPPGQISGNFPPKPKKLSRSESFTILTCLVGVLLMLLPINLIARIAGIILLCVAFAWFVGISHWTHNWSRKYQILSSIGLVILISVFGIPQFVSQWNSKHPIPQDQESLKAQIPDKSNPIEAKESKLPYSISAGPIEGGIALWLVDANKTSIYPVRMDIFFSLVNLQQKASMIDSFAVEGLNAKATWSRLNRVDTQDGAQIYFGENVRDLSLIELRLLDRELRDRNLQSGETALGWMLFAVPPPADFATLRVTITDTAGTHYKSAPFVASGGGNDSLA